MKESVRDQLDRDGYAVLENFLRPQECDEMLAAGMDLTRQALAVEDKTIFSTQENRYFTEKESAEKDKYFLESNDKIRFFFEACAFSPDGKLLVKPELSVNKVAHALHLLHPTFRRYTYSDKIKALCKQLGLIEPAVVQSMYIFKNPGVGGEVVPHQDATYLYTEPIPPVGFWIALEDATVQNGCLWMAPGSHKIGIHRRLRRNPDKESKEGLVYDKPSPDYPESSFIAVPVKKGTCVLIGGNVVHKSAHNHSDKSRHAYTFHMVEKHNNSFASDNWVQEGPNAPFLNVYTTSPKME